jgi:hypothetical protein
MLVSVFVDFLHVDRLTAPSAIGVAASDVLITARPVRSPNDPSSCPACVWQRLAPRQVAQVCLNLTADTVRALLVPLATEWPDSPVPRPAAFRGPPRSTVA